MIDYFSLNISMLFFVEWNQVFRIAFVHLLIKYNNGSIFQSIIGNMNFFYLLDEYINEKQNLVSKNQVRDYRTLRKHLQNFASYSSQPICFQNMNLTFYNELMDYLSNKAKKPNGNIGLLTNSAGKIIRLLKGFINYEVAKENISYINLKSFKVVEEETYAIYLSEQELADIYRLNLQDDEQLEKIRDLFIIGCYTGLRYSDLMALNKGQIDISNENIHLKQRKVHKSVIIPMIDYVPGLLEKYQYTLPHFSNYLFNKRVKELGQRTQLTQKIEIVRRKGNHTERTIHEKWELISSHTCRRSFCTNMYLSGFPAEELMRISGHKSPAAFMRYIKVDNLQAANHLKAFRASYTNKRY